ncbi:ig-like domain-containing protein [Caerostris extrusa]|uniref:Ig-like domain-containing protein n=1 Tax=Caerostris extrusa TaxID=172846 RepID=A0AAV4PN77_CAEEX|nr:ig-like domain-containing protein [Caerostris extrusa]
MLKLQVGQYEKFPRCADHQGLQRQDAERGDGPFQRGDSLHLICEAEGGKPTPSLVWWRSRRIVDDSYEVLEHGITRK